MDGHHRFQVAKELSFKKLPAVKIDYNTIEIWSLRNNEKVSKEIVKERALSNNIFQIRLLSMHLIFKWLIVKFL